MRGTWRRAPCSPPPARPENFSPRPPPFGSPDPQSSFFGFLLGRKNPQLQAEVADGETFFNLFPTSARGNSREALSSLIHNQYLFLLKGSFRRGQLFDTGTFGLAKFQEDVTAHLYNLHDPEPVAVCLSCYRDKFPVFSQPRSAGEANLWFSHGHSCLRTKHPQ